MLDIGEMTFSFAINDKDEIYILDTKNVKVYDSRTKTLDLQNTMGYQVDKRLNDFDCDTYNPKCRGIYCDYIDFYDHVLVDEKDELNNLYRMKENPNTLYTVEYKSILLDLVERYKTYQRVDKHCKIDAKNGTKLTKLQKSELTESLLMKFRKYYLVFFYIYKNCFFIKNRLQIYNTLVCINI